MADTTSSNGNGSQGWMGDVQRALAIILISGFALAVLLATVRLIWIGDAPAINDMAKTLQAALVNMSLIALGFFFGSNMSKVQSDASQQKIVDKLTGNTTPAPVVIAVAPWWPKLTDAEKNAITAAAAADPRVAAFVTASTNGAATSDDVDYLVSKNLLTAERAAVIKAP